MSEDVRKLLGTRIAKLRKVKGLTQLELAELMDVSTSTIANIELGKRFLTNKTLEKITSVLEVEYMELFNFGEIDDIKLAYKETKRNLEYLYKNNPELVRAVRNFTNLLI